MCRVIPPTKKTSGKQTSLLHGGFDFARYPQLKKPMENIGKSLSVPGNFWDKCPAADKEKLFICTIVNYSIMHKFTVGPMRPAYEMQEMGERGSGSLECGDSSGEKFWMPTPDPFLIYYYATYPEKLESGASGENDAEAPDAAADERALTPVVKTEKVRSMTS